MGAPGRIALNMEILEFDKSGKTRGKSFKCVSHTLGPIRRITMIMNVAFGGYGSCSWAHGKPPTELWAH